ncbi:MAG: HAD-IIIC family phosphatase, partial [Oscillospiraceae bacterium]
LGIILTVCSKNDLENATAGLSHPSGALTQSDFALIKANWDNKDQNILSIAETLNIGLNSLVFIDDNPAERNLVKNSLPEVAVPEISKVEEYIGFIEQGGYFETTSLTADDINRTKMYQQNAQRETLRKSFGNYHDYLLSIEMKALISDFQAFYMERISQLTNKSNQFNLTTKRYTQAQINEIFESPSYIRLFGKLKDKFGDNGVVSILIGKRDNLTLHLDLWLMSCRVLKRDMEYAMMDTLVEACGSYGIETIYGYYYPTPKNKMVQFFYKNMGFALVSEDEQGNTVWEFSIKNYRPKNSVIKIVSEEIYNDER